MKFFGVRFCVSYQKLLMSNHWWHRSYSMSLNWMDDDDEAVLQMDSFFYLFNVRFLHRKDSYNTIPLHVLVILNETEA